MRAITDKNTVFSNSSDTIANGLRVGSIATAAGGTAETAHSFLFNNVVTNSTGDGILFDTQFEGSVQNYFSQTVLSGNRIDIDSHPSDSATIPEFFNPPSTINLAFHRPITASPSAAGSLAESAVDGLSYTSWTAADEKPSSLTIDLGGILSFQRIVLKQTAPAIRRIFVLISNDGETFRAIPGLGKRIEANAVANIAFPSVSARFLRLQIETLFGGPASVKEISVHPN